MQLKRGHRLGIDWWYMKTTQSSDTRPVHQTVATTLEFKSNGKAIAIGFTDQRLSPHAGSAAFWGWLRPRDWASRLAAALPHPRRLVVIRHRVREEEPDRAGKRLLDVPGYRFQALVTSLPAASHPPLAVWRYYNGRADCENVIKELREGFALPTLCLEKFWASEAALSLATLTYNLSVLFQRHLGWQQKVTIHSLRFWLFVTAGVLSHPGGQTTVKLAVPERERDWRRRLWEKILSPLPNCNAVENRPAFSG
jgi:hypothetical protein